MIEVAKRVWRVQQKDAQIPRIHPSVDVIFDAC